MIVIRRGLYLFVNLKIGKDVKIIAQFRSFRSLAKLLRDPYLVNRPYA